MDVELGTALRAAGLRVTPGRLAVLEALAEHPHSTAERLRVASGAGLSIQSVHNVLADLTAARMIRRIESAGSAALYERRIGDNHHHVVCTTCGAVADVDCAHGSAPCLTPIDTNGFAIATAEVTFWGQCASCQELTLPALPMTSLLPTIKEIDQ
ncbi:transcriptional repressor [Glaciihabitans sp. INWT7]|uniref:Fur family transcriptional regulator n=1 Tax=Glaciihabitans sp. INWT7 TaxID=2596912 RepID=UPI001628368A|nr:Fur family transcriptional regulator [Glaciihabitans sp. INWT7]QNE46011.1 transcriptional repressor [Glaciihabitans sp. INWT7]